LFGRYAPNGRKDAEGGQQVAIRMIKGRVHTKSTKKNQKKKTKPKNQKKTKKGKT